MLAAFLRRSQTSLAGRTVDGEHGCGCLDEATDLGRYEQRAVDYLTLWLVVMIEIPPVRAETASRRFVNRA